MIVEALVLLLVALLALAACWDLMSFTIPNALSLVLIAAFVLFVAVSGMTLGHVGGGDAKLFACIALWLGFSSLAEFAIVASLFGGGLALLIISLRSVPLPASLSGQSWIVRLHDSRSGIPYGVALAAGALVVLPHTEVFRIAFA